MTAGYLAIAAAFDDDGGDDELSLGHGLTSRNIEVSTMSRDSCQLCPEIRHCRGHHDLFGAKGLILQLERVPAALAMFDTASGALRLIWKPGFGRLRER